jgi:hypothetical protein
VVEHLVKVPHPEEQEDVGREFIAILPILTHQRRRFEIGRHEKRQVSDFFQKEEIGRVWELKMENGRRGGMVMVLKYGGRGQGALCREEPLCFFIFGNQLL